MLCNLKGLTFTGTFLQKLHEKYTFFISNQGYAPGLKVAHCCKIFSTKSCLTVAKSLKTDLIMYGKFRTSFAGKKVS